MNHFWYRRQVKVTCFVIQGLLAGLVVFCALLFSLWNEQQGLSHIRLSFEESQTFLSRVQTIIEEKISSDQRKDLFEQNGTYAPDKPVDIRQYATDAGMLDQTSRNPSLSYSIADLLTFADTDAQTMLSQVDEVVRAASSEEERDALLTEEASQLETILPESGTLLADYVRVEAGGTLTLSEAYRLLAECALDISDKYEKYSADSTEESGEAPSNVLYYVENTSTKQRYSNIGAVTMSEAIFLVEDTAEMTFLFEGERRSNIMVVEEDHVLNEEVSQWFSQSPLLSNNEKIVLAVDLDYSVGDSLQSTYLNYRKRAPLMRILLVAVIVFTVLFLTLVVVSVVIAGKSEQEGETILLGMDKMPTEIEAALSVILVIIGSIVLRRQFQYVSADEWSGLLRMAGVAFLYDLALIGIVLSIARRLRAHNLWTGSVAYYVILGSRQVLNARKASGRLLVIYIAFLLLNLFFLMIGGLSGAVMMLTINLAALLYLMRDNVGNANIREGLQQIQAGKLDYRINVNVLAGESRQLGEAVNEMGEGLQKAVDSMIQGERLKAELITNVSHDLKTPLTSIINYVDLLKREDSGSERAKEYLMILDQKTQRLKALVTDLIEISKISSGNVELHNIDLDLREFLLQAVGEFEDRFEEKKLKLKMQLPRQRMMIEADGEQLWRVFENLMGNMAKYALPDSEAVISLKQEKGWITISFRNVPEMTITATAEQLMERFARGDASRTTEGSGLGLSIARSLTEYMGGTFQLDVRSDDFCVTVSFPEK